MYLKPRSFFERSNKAVYSFLSGLKGKRMTISIVQPSTETLYSVNTDTALPMSVSIRKHKHTLHICTHTQSYAHFLYIYSNICTLQLFIILWVTYILCNYSFIASFVNISCLCICVDSYVCTYVCIYTFHLHTSRTYIYSCIYAHKILRIYKHLSTLAYLFVCLIIYVCLCA